MDSDWEYVADTNRAKTVEYEERLRAELAQERDKIPLDHATSVMVQNIQEARKREYDLAEAIRASAAVRRFDSGATRDSEDGKLDYEGFFHPSTMERFAHYMDENRTQKDGSVRSSDNWQKGIPVDAYMKSAFRHFHEWWSLHRKARQTALTQSESDAMEVALCALWFNVQGYLFELLKEKPV